MFDFSMGELAVIGAIALVVLGPERLPKVARTVGDWLGKAQRYVSQVKADINREMELAELKKLQEEARSAAQAVQSQVNDLQNNLSSFDNLPSADVTDPPSPASGADYAWEGGGETWVNTRFARRYKPGLSVDDLAEEVSRLKRQLALPESQHGYKRKYQPRARTNRPRIRR
jgi:sec-independent protein translocase protein TatB